MPRSITIRDVPDETADVLASRAALTGRSLQEYLRAQLDQLVEKPDVDVWLARVRTLKAATGASSVSVEDILADRDADRT